jgi:ribonucleoside-diphosphate reductase alpha chain
LTWNPNVKTRATGRNPYRDRERLKRLRAKRRSDSPILLEIGERELEQPLAPNSVCNLAAVNLAEMADKVTKTVNFEKLQRTVEVGVRMQDNVIDATPYFLEDNKKQALSERRVGLGVMGLHDLLIYCETEYGSEEGNKLVDKVFETIATTAYRTSVELAKEKGSFPYLEGETNNETNRLREAFINSGFMKKMPEDIRQSIVENGIRNSHLLTVAPKIIGL